MATRTEWSELDQRAVDSLAALTATLDRYAKKYQTTREDILQQAGLWPRLSEVQRKVILENINVVSG